jgi:hypothetical protein
MGELIDINQLKDMVLAALEERGAEVFVSMMASTRSVQPIVRDGEQKWWKHEVEMSLSHV